MYVFELMSKSSFNAIKHLKVSIIHTKSKKCNTVRETFFPSTALS